MQWGPLASSETTATSQARARYAAATQPHGSPSSASSSKMVPVGRTELLIAAGTVIPLTLPRQPPDADDPLALTAISGPAIRLDRLSEDLVPTFSEVDEKKGGWDECPPNGADAWLTLAGDTF